MKLIIISGPEATGKTNIGHHLSKELSIPYLGKDDIKEAMFDKKPRNTWHFVWYEKQAKAED